MPNPTPAIQPYNRRPAPPQYDKGYLNLELLNVQRAIPRRGTRSVTSSGPVLATDDLVLVDATSGAITMTLPAADRVQFLRVTIKKIDVSAHAVTISGTVDGTVNPSLGSQWNSLTVQNDGTSWYKLASV